jgi:hypothetical protein
MISVGTNLVKTGLKRIRGEVHVEGNYGLVLHILLRRSITAKVHNLALLSRLQSRPRL